MLLGGSPILVGLVLALHQLVQVFIILKQPKNEFHSLTPFKRVANIGMSTGAVVELRQAHQVPPSMTETIELLVNFVAVLRIALTT